MPIAGLPLERPVNLTRLLETGLRTKPNEPALISLDSKWTWRELEQASRRLAAHYLQLGLKPGDRVDFHFTIESGMSATVTQITPAK